MACSDFAGEIAYRKKGDRLNGKTGIKYRTLNTVFSMVKRHFLCLFVTEERGEIKGRFF